MACFVVPLTQAIVTTVYRRRLAKVEANENHRSLVDSTSLKNLELMLWGGSAMLVVDHIISGELMPMFPFFSALLKEGGMFTMLREMLTVGVPMSLLVTAVWGISLALHRREA